MKRTANRGFIKMLLNVRYNGRGDYTDEELVQIDHRFDIAIAALLGALLVAVIFAGYQFWYFHSAQVIRIDNGIPYKLEIIDRTPNVKVYTT